MRRTITILRRYSGFPGVALGGYTAGLLAREIGPMVEVRFRGAVPVEKPLDLDAGAGEVTLSSGGVVLAEGRAAPVDIGPIPLVDREAAARATLEPLGRERHLFPTCFCCGPANSEREGLRVLVGRVLGQEALAGVWTAPPAFADPDGTMPPEITLAAIDCPGIWALIVAAPADTAEHVVTGTLAVHMVRALRAGESYVVTAWTLGREGRRLHAGTAILAEGGRPMVIAKHTLVATETGVPLARRVWFPAEN